MPRTRAEKKTQKPDVCSGGQMATLEFWADLFFEETTADNLLFSLSVKLKCAHQSIPIHALFITNKTP